VTPGRLLDATLPAGWPLVDLLDALPMQVAADKATEAFGIWVMIQRADREVVGDIGFMGPPGPDGSVEIGYSVMPDRRRAGYATEAVAALLAWVLGQRGVSRVLAQCEPANAASVRTLERAGFERTGVTEDGLLAWLFTRPADAKAGP
jgi:ribosomal-protein-alanine N-acetyltransferase